MKKRLDKCTKNEVEKYLERAKLYKASLPKPKEQRLTATYERREHQSTNLIHSQPEAIAIDYIDEVEKRRQHIELVDGAIEQLSEIKKKIIELMYMSKEKVLYVNLTFELGYSETHCRRMKNEALFELAVMFGLTDI